MLRTINYIINTKLNQKEHNLKAKWIDEGEKNHPTLKYSKMWLTVINNVGVTNNSCCISIVVVFQYCKLNFYNEIHPHPLLKSEEDPGFEVKGGVSCRQGV